MKQIWKFRLFDRERLGDGSVQVPKGAEYLTCQTQNGHIYAWFIVDPTERNLEPRKYQMIGTGHDFNPEGLRHFATLQESGYVWHLFEEVA